MIERSIQFPFFLWLGVINNDWKIHPNSEKNHFGYGAQNTKEPTGLVSYPFFRTVTWAGCLMRSFYKISTKPILPSLTPFPTNGMKRSKNSRSRIPILIKEFKYFYPKTLFLSSRKYDPGGSSQIRIFIFYPSQIPDPRVKSPRIRNTVTQEVS